MATKQQQLELEKFHLISSTVSTPQDGSSQNSAQEMAAEMSFVHNMIIRGIKSIHEQAEGVSSHGSPQDKLDFANYAMAWSKFIHHHHEFEENVAFPDANRITGVEGLMDANIEEHKVFHDGLGKFAIYLADVLSEKVTFEGKTLVGIIDGFMPVLRHHLRNEIDTLLDLERFADTVDWNKWFAGMLEQVMASAMRDTVYKTEIFPLLFCLHDRSFENRVWANKPPIPWVVVTFMRWWYFGRKRAWWCFAPCDMYGRPKVLPSL